MLTLNLGTAKIVIDKKGRNEYNRYLSLPLVDNDNKRLDNNIDEHDVQEEEEEGLSSVDDDADDDDDSVSDFEDANPDTVDQDDLEDRYTISDDEDESVIEANDDNSVPTLEHRRYSQ